MDLVQQDYDALVNSICDNCCFCFTCKSVCRRKRLLLKLVNEYNELNKAYDHACAELVLGSQFFMTSTRDEVKEYFRGNNDGN